MSRMPSEFNAWQASYDLYNKDFNDYFEENMKYIKKAYEMPTEGQYGQYIFDTYDKIWEAIKKVVINRTPTKYQKCNLNKFKKFFVEKSLKLLNKFVKKWNGKQHVYENIIKENASSVLYHFTDFDTFKKIAESNDFKLSKTNEYNSANNDIDSNTVNNELNGNYKYYISFTRSPNANQGFSQWYMPNSNMSDFKEDDESYKGIVRIEFDGNKLNEHFKSRPIDFFTHKFQTMSKKDRENHEKLDKIKFPNNTQNTSSKEVQLTTPNQFNTKNVVSNPNPFFVQNEDRLFSNESIIENVSKYITRVDIKIYDKYKEKYYQDVFNIVYKTILGQEDKIHLYDNFNGLNRFKKDKDMKIDGDIKGDSTSFETIDENYRQLEIPFDGNTTKYNYLQFIDHLEELGHYGKLTSSKYNPLKDEETVIEVAQESFYMGWNEESEELDDEGWTMFLDDIIEKYDIEIDYDLSPWEILDYYGQDETDKEFQIIKKELIKVGSNCLKRLMKLVTWKRGLIYVERAINIADLMGKADSYFNILQDSYDGIGRFWSWKKDNSDSYWDDYAIDDTNGMHNSFIILRGYVDPKDVEWGISVRVNEYIGEESELRISGEVEVYEITDGRNGAKFPLQKPLIIHT